MSERSLSEAEFDLLADYTAGVLEEPEASEIEALIARDPIWSGTHAALVEFDAPVRAALAGQVDEPMPADVADRITAALAELTPGSNVVSLDAARQRRQRSRRVLAIAAAIVGVVGGIGFASAYLSPTLNSGEATSAPAMGPGIDRGQPGGGTAAEDAAGAPQAAIGIRIFTSGTDYNAGTLAQIKPPLAAAGPPAFSASGAKDNAPAVPPSVRQAAPPGLARLTDPAALAECLSAIARVYPGVATYAEYARYGGAPALIVIVNRPTGSTIVAVGPDCGLAGPNEKAYVLVP